MTNINLANPLVQQLNDILHVNKHEDFLNLLEDKLVDISNKICSSSKKISTLKSNQKIREYCSQETDKAKRKELLEYLDSKLEDDITIQIVNLLNEAGFLAAHDQYHNGHVDIFIESSNKKFKWLGEAKLYGGVKYTEQGLFQLVGDYSLGNINESGGVLIYINSTTLSVRKIMEDWQAQLVKLSKTNKTMLSNLKYSYLPSNPLVLISEHDHHRSGIPYRIRHACLDIRPTV